MNSKLIEDNIPLATAPLLFRCSQENKKREVRRLRSLNLREEGTLETRFHLTFSPLPSPFGFLAFCCKSDHIRYCIVRYFLLVSNLTLPLQAFENLPL